MVNINEIIKRIKLIANLKRSQDIAELFSLSPSDFSNRKKRGTLLPLIVDWSIHEFVNINWLFTGHGDQYTNVVNGTPIGSSNTIAMKDAIEAKHEEIIKGFKQKDLARELNFNALKLERLNPPALSEVNEYIKFKVHEEEKKQGERKPGARTKKKVNG